MKTKLKPNQFLLSGHLITERPILFQTEMVQAILEDRKTQTRRKINPQPNPEFFKLGGDYPPHQVSCSESEAQYVFLRHPKTGRAVFINDAPKIYGENGNPFGKPGDLLWVRETFAELEEWDSIGSKIKYDYLADGRDILVKYKPSIHMPKTASRIWLMVEDVRVERLWEITEEDAITEGIKREVFPETGEYCYYFYPCKDLRDDSYLDCPIASFYSLWVSINGRNSWKANPWIWVIKYRILSKTGRPSDEDILTSHLSILKS